jgi:hypothetical protein
MTDEFSVIERPHGGSHARAVLVERVAGQAAPGPSGTVTLTAS